MSQCPCCNLTLEPEYALENRFCPVCDHAGCTAHYSEHSDERLKVHKQKRLNEEQQ
ncbi:hypothetical protein [Halomonas sp.]|uniref:hypothetical protein n=1 Tax=Halomonas sp. TaxID=1486246 RepID=UPI00356346C2